MLFDLDLTSQYNFVTCSSVNVKLLNTRVSFQGQNHGVCTSQNRVHPSVTVFGGTTNYLHDSSLLCPNQMILILLAQFSK